VKCGKPLRRTPLRRGTSTLKRTRLRPRSERGWQRQAERQRNMILAYGYVPDCEGRGILPVCPPANATYRHVADDAHEPAKRSQGADPTDPAQAIPVCRDGHDWIHDHPAQASQLRTRQGRPFLNG
jgi:hypothetical protein